MYVCTMDYVLFIAVVLTFYLDTADLCINNKFGHGCLSTCHCHNDARCDAITGTCRTGCAAGWNGPACQKENIAYRRSTSQMDGKTSRDANYAVDGKLSTCSRSKQSATGWWTLRLNTTATVSTVTLVAGRSTNIKGWRIYVGMDSVFSMRLCATVRVHSNAATIRCEEAILGKYVKVVNRVGPVEICELTIQVCSKFWFGTECDKRCNCADQSEVCDTETGACASGCSVGWTGLDCQTACKGRYGDSCKHACGHCNNNDTCDHVTGVCKNGCQAGWTGSICLQECKNNTFGKNCEKRCGHCRANATCDPVSGICKDGCQPGYGDAQCIQECKSGWYGEGCNFKCGHCLRDSPCDRKLGICDQGCEDGWEGAFCTQECLDGYYGRGCAIKCATCYQSDCDKRNGRCLQDCIPGYMGDRCETGCLPGYYGINCAHECGNCNQSDVCDSKSGVCGHGCLPGYSGDTCSEPCPEGFFGAGCGKCGVCKAGTTCDPFTGICPEGCAPDYHGQQCSESEAFTDENTPQLQIFLGTAIGTVGSMMILVVICLVLIWQREHLPDADEHGEHLPDADEHRVNKELLTKKQKSVTSVKDVPVVRENGCLPIGDNADLGEETDYV